MEAVASHLLRTARSLDANALREQLDRLRAALGGVTTFIPRSGTLAYDHQAIAARVRGVIETLDKIDLSAANTTSGPLGDLPSEFPPARLRQFIGRLQDSLIARVQQVLGEQKLEAVRALLSMDMPDVMQAMRKEHDENAHSDLIAWLLDPRQAPTIAPPALRALCQRLGPKWSEAISSAIHSQTISVRREVVLARALHDGHDLSRVDITVSGPDFMLAIENKLWTLEHDDQTKTYWSHLEALDGLRGGLFLSPSGMMASCPAFLPVSYLDLISAMVEGPARGPVPAIERTMLGLYLTTLFAHVCSSEASSIHDLFTRQSQ